MCRTIVCKFGTKLRGYECVPFIREVKGVPMEVSVFMLIDDHLDSGSIYMYIEDLKLVYNLLFLQGLPSKNYKL